MRFPVLHQFSEIGEEGLGRVARQYTGTTGKIDDFQLGMFLAYASNRRRWLV
ncbi:MAG: hypothetical protein ACRDTD_12630 [Pseudonocardiaceae bacterium]